MPLTRSFTQFDCSLQLPWLSKHPSTSYTWWPRDTACRFLPSWCRGQSSLYSRRRQSEVGERDDLVSIWRMCISGATCRWISHWPEALYDEQPSRPLIVSILTLVSLFSKRLRWLTQRTSVSSVSLFSTLDACWLGLLVTLVDVGVFNRF